MMFVQRLVHFTTPSTRHDRDHFSSTHSSMAVNKIACCAVRYFDDAVYRTVVFIVIGTRYDAVYRTVVFIIIGTRYSKSSSRK